MDFPMECLERIDILLRKVSGQLTASDGRNVSPEAKSLLITLNKLNRNLRNIDFEKANAVTSYHYLQGLIKYFEIFLRDFAKNQRTLFHQAAKDCMIIFQSRVEFFLDAISNALYYDKNDLCSLPSDHPRWDRLRAFVQFHKYKNPKKIEEHLDFMIKRLLTGQAAIIDAYSESGSLSPLVLGKSAFYYSLFPNAAAKKLEVFHARPHLGIMKILYNLAETDWAGIPFTLLMPYISVNRTFFIPRTTSHIFDPFQYKDIDPSIQCAPSDNVSVRFLSNDRKFHTSLIIHIHGGGFIAMSSRSHQCYTRKWVRGLKIPCISIDYRLSPEHPYPAALDDVWQVYNWVLRYSESHLNVRPDKIFLVGDSAGGNIALSLTYRLLEQNLKAPTGLMLAYPAINLSKKQFSLSAMYAFDDKLISFGFLKMSIEAYVPEEFCLEDYYISPVGAPSRILEKLPPTRIVVGDKDPLHDECWRFTEKLLDTGVDVEFCVFEKMIHGALSLCFKGGVKGSGEMVDKFEKWIRELLDRPSNN